MSLDDTPKTALDSIDRDEPGPVRQAIWSGLSVGNCVTMLKEASKGIAAQFSTIN